MIVELAHDDLSADFDTGSADPSDTTPLVLLHAFPLSRRMFDAMAPYLTAAGFRLILPDLRGFGDSPGPGEDEPSLDHMADDVAALLDRLNIDRAVVGGVSLGGYVTMAMLRRHPERVAGVALIDTKAAADTEDARANRERIATVVLEHGSRALAAMPQSLLGQTTQHHRPQIVEQVHRWIAAVRPDGVAWAQRAMAARTESFTTLSAATVPGVVVVGAEDELTGQEDAQAMARELPVASGVHVVAGAGHLSPVERPEAVAGVLRDVLRGSGTARGGETA